jgi:nicotinate-nucleotide adenylyltransferase
LRKIGIYGGSFDPIHHGHLIQAREACETLALEKMIFVPAAISPHKVDRVPAAAEIRREMLQEAIDGEAGFTLDDCELRRGPPSYTIETVEFIRKSEGDAQIFYFVGQDNVTDLPTWHRFSELQTMIQFVVLDRTGFATEQLYPVIRRHIDISGTEIRKRVATGRSIRYLVPPAVEAIIRRYQLYQELEK